MSKVICNLAVSLDGYIAELDGNVDFLGNEFSEEQTKQFNDFLNQIDIIVMGSTSYDRMLELGGNTFTSKHIYVLTSREYEELPNVTFVDSEISDLLLEMKERSLKNIWLFGGAKVIKQFIEIDEVDEFIITIAPIVLGSGIPMFLFTKEKRELRLINSQKNDDFVTLHYIRKR